MRRIFPGKVHKNLKVPALTKFSVIMKNYPNKKLHRDHVQIDGQAFYDKNKYFMFSPDIPMIEQVDSFRAWGVAKQMADGTFDFVPIPRAHPESRLIRKLAHGRASETKDGAIQLTLKVFVSEGVNISATILRESMEASVAISDYLKRGGYDYEG